MLLLLPPVSLVAMETQTHVLDSIDNDKFTGDLAQMRKRKIIRALVTYSRTDFFIHKGHFQGMQAEYLQAYEQFLNKGIKKNTDKVKIIVIPVPFNRLIPDLIAGKGDIAAAFLTITSERQQRIAFTSTTDSKVHVNEVIVTHHDFDHIKNIQQLAGQSIHVLHGSSYIEHLQKLNQEFITQGLEPINIKQLSSLLTGEDLLEMVNSGIINFTVVDDYRAHLWAKVLPNINVRDDLMIHQRGQIGWAVRKNNPQLLKNLDLAAKQAKRGTLLGNVLFKRYFKNTQWINNPLSDSERTRLQQSIRLFRKYGDQFQIDYHALLAQAYQESGLDHNRTNPSGAVGIMQLLPSTAADHHVMIENIHELENNIHAGAKYMAFLRSHYFTSPDISTLDQLLLSWAAYNAGPRQVQRMRNLTRKLGLNQNKWFNNVEIAAGKIVGEETVKYVSNIYKYYIAYAMTNGIP